ncbi:Chromobox -like protein 2 [Trichinella pseudospiralis]|uniref:Chromobox-like protein 2 n=1 Tax=Trichinella pseudospiralis TaxID=6337 RepID=A0A0V1FZ24_TRIPS|nr:Chromobox -like protein 2 [Trichinella pseudospiralis]
MSETQLENVFPAEKIVATRIRNGERQYLVRWKGFSSYYDSWEPSKHILDDRLITFFEASCVAAKLKRRRRRCSRLGMKRRSYAKNKISKATNKKVVNDVAEPSDSLISQSKEEEEEEVTAISDAGVVVQSELHSANSEIIQIDPVETLNNVVEIDNTNETELNASTDDQIALLALPPALSPHYPVDNSSSSSEDDLPPTTRHISVITDRLFYFSNARITDVLCNGVNVSIIEY